MKTIGGYFELELNKDGREFHSTPYQLKSGRASLSVILAYIRPARVYVPYYTCDTLLEPFRAMNVAFSFYEINEALEPKALPLLGEGEYFLYVNYFDLKRDAVTMLSEKYKDRLIVDCTQAFFLRGNGISWYFNSCRKFFGVPDGSYLYAPAGVVVAMPEERNEAYETSHLIKRFNGDSNKGYEDFRMNEEMAGKGVTRMSVLTEFLLSNVDYNAVAEKRKANYSYLHDSFKGLNQMKAPGNAEAPMSFPLLLSKPVNRALLFASRIFIPTLWIDTQDRGVAGFGLEKRLPGHLLPLPVDHRYSLDDMEFLCTSVKSIL